MARTIVTALAAMLMMVGLLAGPALGQETPTGDDGYPVDVESPADGDVDVDDDDDVDVDDEVDVDDDVNVDDDADDRVDVDDGAVGGVGDATPPTDDDAEVLGLAFGGVELTLLAVVAAVVLAAGTALVVAGRRRRGSAA